MPHRLGPSSNPIIHDKFNTYRLPSAGYFAGHQVKIINLLVQEFAVRLRTQAVVRGMDNALR